MSNDYQAIVDFPFAKLGIKCSSSHLLGIEFLSASTIEVKACNQVAQLVVKQLWGYIKDAHYKFDLPVLTQGTVYQRRVWSALSKIKAGKAHTYGFVAKRLDSGARAVGNACRHNPVPIVVPCHRVIAVSGIGGFVGKTKGLSVNRKIWLLKHEGVNLTH